MQRPRLLKCIDPVRKQRFTARTFLVWETAMNACLVWARGPCTNMHVHLLRHDRADLLDGRREQRALFKRTSCCVSLGVCLGRQPWVAVSPAVPEVSPVRRNRAVRAIARYEREKNGARRIACSSSIDVRGVLMSTRRRTPKTVNSHQSCMHACND